MEQENKIEESKIEETPKEEEKIVEDKIAQTKCESGKKCCGGNCKVKKFVKKNKTGIAIAVLVVLIAASAAYKYLPKKTDIGPVAAKAKIEKFIKENLVQPGTDVAVKDVTLEGDLYKVVVTVSKQDVTAYLTKDGSKFFPQVIEVDKASEADKANKDQAPEKTEADVKADVPEVKLFVMSYCPYGTQMEKGILPVIQKLGAKIKFTLEFVDYSMHNSLAQNDRKELDENLRQYCIQKNQPTKLAPYLTAFLKKGQGTEAASMTQAGINAAQIASCMKDADAQFNVTKDFNDKSSYQGSFPQFEVNKEDNAKYGVQGSPTLVINGSTVSPAGRDSQSILKTVCSGFKNQPAECAQALSTTAPAPGFGEAAAAAGAAPAQCTTPQQ